MLDFLLNPLENEGEEILIVAFCFKKFEDLRDSFSQLTGESYFLLIRCPVPLVLLDEGEQLQLVGLWLILIEERVGRMVEFFNPQL